MLKKNTFRSRCDRTSPVALENITKILFDFKYRVELNAQINLHVQVRRFASL